MWLRRVGWFLLGLCLMAAVGGAAYLIARRPVKPKPPTPAAFAELVAHRLAKRYPDLRASVDQEEEKYFLVVTPASPQSRTPLAQLYAAALRSPQRRDQLIDEFLQRAAQGLREPATETLDQVRDHLLPMIKRRSFVVEYNEGKQRDDRVPWRPLPNDLVICWVVDYAAQVRYVTLGDLHRWGRELGEVGTRALTNLIDRTEGQPMTVARSSHGEVYFYDWGDGYDATRLLVLQSQRAAPNPVWKEDLIVAIPDRDLLAAAPVSAAEAMRALMPRIKEDASSRQQPLTDKLFLVRPSGVQPYQLPAPVPPAR